MDKTPSLGRALVGLTVLIAVIVGGYLLLKTASDNESAAGNTATGDAIRFVRSGGFAGETISFLVFPDGQVRVLESPKKNQTETVQVPRRQAARVFRAIDNSDWPDQEELWPPGGCADCYQYDITYQSAHVRFFEPVPEQYAQVTSLLSRLADRI